jgi:hypothetical protein
VYVKFLQCALRSVIRIVRVVACPTPLGAKRTVTLSATERRSASRRRALAEKRARIVIVPARRAVPEPVATVL